MSSEKRQLTRSLKNDRNKKDLLRTELNNATDPNVRLELTKMLLDVEKKEKRKKITKWISLFSGLIIISFILFYLGTNSTKNHVNKNLAKVSHTTNSQSASSKSTSTSSTISETNLSENQLKKWVMAILELAPAPPSKYVLNVRIDDKDKLAYISAGIDQMDGFGTFRVNVKGQLEFMPYMGQFSGNDWTVISEKYMDTSLAKEYFDEQKKKQTSANDSLNNVKKQLVGKKYVIKPILYDDMDAEQAMNDNKAPQNLIHDGMQPITFTSENSVHIELAGTYRPDYDETYTVSNDTINLKDYYIPYTYSDGNFSFDTWTTEESGHTITWAMTSQ
ncbi:hypothetical protein ACWOAH_08915 [Vagococcus vulneris]|uniref:Uncharacterized protein n=1 Tax=Vagococcus vulneris TaxID=1977869 RepID=A0A430A1K2_9ENTE|nr:hypothetical protein [Vagococcus vulneris]RSU00244.1 hypothetical protein CBF37_02805 [Vagococcus vulneris]